MGSFKLLYKSFYDASLFSEFVMKGKKLGIAPLALVSFISTALITLLLYILVSSFSFNALRPLFTGLPELTVTDGEVRGDVIVTKDVMGKSKDFFFVVNTSSETADFSGLPDTGIFVAKKDVFFKGGKRIHSLAFKEFLPSGTTVLNESFFENGFNTVKGAVLKVFLPIFCLAFFVFSFWGLMNALLFFVFISYVFSAAMKKSPTLEQRTRIAALSLLPSAVLSIITGVFGVTFSYAIYFIISLVYMFTYFKRMENRPAVGDSI